MVAYASQYVVDASESARPVQHGQSGRLASNMDKMTRNLPPYLEAAVGA
jgi:hypothetical protein